MDRLRDSPARGDGRAEVWILLAVALVLGGAFVWALVLHPPEDRTDGVASASPTTSTAAPSSTLPPPRPFKVLDGVNVRAGPGTSYGVVGRIELGNEAIVECRTEGQTIDGPAGSTDQWLRVTVGGTTGYVTAAYVNTKGALDDPAVIGLCPST